MDDNQKVLDYIIDAMMLISKAYVNTAGFDKTFPAVITEVVESGGYKVKIAGAVYPIQSSLGDTELIVGDKVWVTAPQNKFSDIYISGKRI